MIEVCDTVMYGFAGEQPSRWRVTGHLKRVDPVPTRNPKHSIEAMIARIVRQDVYNEKRRRKRIERGIFDAAEIDLRTATVDEIDGIFGIGPKTARLFVLHSRSNAEVAVLDRHILHWLRDLGVENVPQDTPQSEKDYLRLESLAIALMKANYPGLPLAYVDLFLWAKYSGRLNEVEETAGFLYDKEGNVNLAA